MALKIANPMKPPYSAVIFDNKLPPNQKHRNDTRGFGSILSHIQPAEVYIAINPSI